MNIEELREYCIHLPSVTEDIKWENMLRQSYDLVVARLPKKQRENLYL